MKYLCLAYGDEKDFKLHHYRKRLSIDSAPPQRIGFRTSPLLIPRAKYWPVPARTGEQFDLH
jgi:hypothetical protein